MEGGRVSGVEGCPEKVVGRSLPLWEGRKREEWVGLKSPESEKTRAPQGRKDRARVPQSQCRHTCTDGCTPVAGQVTPQNRPVCPSVGGHPARC